MNESMFTGGWAVISMLVEKCCTEVKSTVTAGTSLKRVRRMHSHPLKFSNGCAAPVLRTVNFWLEQPF